MKIIIYIYIISTVACQFSLNILHLNDIHSRFEETSIKSGRCGEVDKKNNNCFGGFARIHTKVSELRNSLDNTLFLSAGDNFQGTAWYAVHKWKALAYFLNLIKLDVMVLGNHEFDDGIEGLIPFLDNVTFPVIAANIDDSLEPSFQGKYSPNVVLTIGGRQVGVIGYLTTETAFISDSAHLKFLNEVDSVRAVARKLKAEGVDIIIALGHSGFKTDKEIAEQVEEVDIVVGGHTNTFLYNGDDPSTETSIGKYPTIVTQASGRKVPVVQAYAFGKYLGHLEVTFNEEGEAISWNGNPILLDNSILKDETILKELIPWKVEIHKMVSGIVGRTFVFLDGTRTSCRRKECNLGNLMADAIVHQNAKYPDDLKWAHTSLAVVNSGSIRASIDEITANGSISLEDILAASPFQNSIHIVELKGKHLKEMFEFSVSDYDISGKFLKGNFLQVSGFHVIYKLDEPVGSRVVKLEARCTACRIPILEPIDDEDIYKVAMPSFLSNGGDGFAVIRENKIKHHVSGLLDSEIYSEYIRLYSPIYQGIENRIQFVEEDDPCDGSNCYSAHSQTGTGCQQGKLVTEYEVNTNSGNNNEISLLLSAAIIAIYALLTI